MKNLLVLAGGSPRNRAWGEACKEFFKSGYDATFFIQYSHWDNGGSNLDFKVELEKIAETIKNADSEAEWYVLAKSVGSILTLKAVHAGIMNPVKCVFFGMPFSVFPENIYEDTLSSFSVPTLAFHTDNDPTANYEIAKEKITKYLQTITFKTLSGNTHDYLDFGEYEDEIKVFLNS